MKYLRKFLNLFPYADKVLHFIAGFFITIVSGYILGFMTILAVAFGIMAGLLKEVVDSFTGGQSNGKDWLATIAGSLLAALFLWQ